MSKRKDLRYYFSKSSESIQKKDDELMPATKKKDIDVGKNSVPSTSFSKFQPEAQSTGSIFAEEIGSKPENACLSHSQSTESVSISASSSLFNPIRTGLKRANKDEDESILKHTHRDGRHYVQCVPCSEYSDIVKFHLPSNRKKLPPIAEEGGAIYRETTFKEHFAKEYHVAAFKKFKLTSLSTTEQLQSTPIGK